VLGRKETDKLNLRKQALLLESNLNRHAFEAEFHNLRAATAWMSDVAQASREFSPLLLMLAPVAGFLLARSSRRPDSWLSRIIAAAKWAGPLYTLWKRFSAGREKHAGTGAPPI
jgi:hypothetical protein